jgi:hypothetical protein
MQSNWPLTVSPISFEREAVVSVWRSAFMYNPEPYAKVLVTNGKSICISSYCPFTPSERKCRFVEESDYFHVTHWMPLPRLPEGAKNTEQQLQPDSTQ